MKSFTVKVDDTGTITFENSGMFDYEIIGVMRLLEADLFGNREVDRKLREIKPFIPFGKGQAISFDVKDTDE